MTVCVRDTAESVGSVCSQQRTTSGVNSCKRLQDTDALSREVVARGSAELRTSQGVPHRGPEEGDKTSGIAVAVTRFAVQF